MIIIIIMTLISGAISTYIMHKTPEETVKIMEDVAEEAVMVMGK